MSICPTPIKNLRFRGRSSTSSSTTSRWPCRRTKLAIAEEDTQFEHQGPLAEARAGARAAMHPMRLPRHGFQRLGIYRSKPASQNLTNYALLRTYAYNCVREAAMRISVILPEPDSTRFGAYCDQNGYKKSTLICRLIREHLENEKFALQTEMKLDHQAGDDQNG